MTTPSPLKPSRLQRALELAGHDPLNCTREHADAVRVLADKQLNNTRAMSIALANVLLRLVDLDEQAAAHPVYDYFCVECRISMTREAARGHECGAEVAAHTVAASPPGEDDQQTCERGQCTPHLTEMCGKHQDAYEANCVERNLEQGLTTDGFAADAERERNPVIAVIDDYIAGLRLTLDEALAKLTASEVRCNQLTGERDEFRQQLEGAEVEWAKAGRVVAELRADLARERGWDLHRKEAMCMVVEAAREVIEYLNPNGVYGRKLHAALSALDAAPEATSEPVAIVIGSKWRDKRGQELEVTDLHATFDNENPIRLGRRGYAHYIDEAGLRAEYTHVSDPSAPEIPDSSVCTCYHAPEQHHANGCEMTCGCKWDGVRLPALRKLEPDSSERTIVVTPAVSDGGEG